MHYKNIVTLIILFLNFIFFSFSADFVSIKSKSNLRAGPGQQYPINWILKFSNMPVKVLEKSSSYTKVELYDGTVGWIWNATISKRKFYIITEDSYIVDIDNKKIAIAKKNVLFEQIHCEEFINNEAYCKVNKNNIKGYLIKKNIWGIDSSSQENLN